MGCVSVLEIFILRRVIWQNEDRVTIAELTSAILLWERWEVERTMSGGDMTMQEMTISRVRNNLIMKEEPVVHSYDGDIMTGGDVMLEIEKRELISVN